MYELINYIHNKLDKLKGLSQEENDEFDFYMYILNKINEFKSNK